jgi:hypothetical protein
MSGSVERETGDGRGEERVVALFGSQADAEQAILDLNDAGFSEESIGVVLRDPAYGYRRRRRDNPQPLPAEAPSGGILGGVVGLLAGVRALALPRVGPVIAGGWLVGPLAGAGGLLGTLIGLGIPDGAARYFEEGVRDGSVLVLVDAGARKAAAGDILRFSRGDLGTHRLPYAGPERRLTHR